MMNSSRNETKERWDLDKYFDLIIEKDYEDFQSNASDIRFALHLCSSLNHLLDWYYHHNNSELKKINIEERQDLISTLNENCFCLEVVRDISNSFKHYELKNPRCTNKQHSTHEPIPKVVKKF